MAKSNRKVASMSIYFDADGEPGEVHIVEKIRVIDPPMITTRKTDLTMDELAPAQQKSIAGVVSALQKGADAKHLKELKELEG